MGAPVFFPKFRAFDHSTGAPLAGGLVYFYAAGTSTPQSTWADSAFVSANPNPVVLDANGEAWIFGGAAPYKVVLNDANGTLQWTGDNLTFASTLQSSVSGHNFLMNGGFEVWQQATSFVGVAAGQLCDGWAMRDSSGGFANFTLSRQPAGAAQSQYCMRVQRNAASGALDTIQLIQNIETLDAIPLQGQFVNVSFLIRAGANFSGGVLFNAVVATGTGTDEAFQATGSFTGNATYGGVGSNPSLTTAWQQYSFVVGPILSNANEAAIQFVIGAWLGTAGAADYVEIDNVQLEIGQAMTPFEREPWEALLDRCQRRYYKSFPYATAPAQNAGVAGAYAFPQVVAAATAMTTGTLPAPTMMRDVAGTITAFNPSVANAQARNSTVGADCTVTTGVITSNEAHFTLSSAAGSAAGNVNLVHYVIDKRI